MQRKKLQHITLKSQDESLKRGTNTTSFLTAENIEITSKYSENDTVTLEHLDFVAGIAPYLRGANSTMYVKSPWAINQLVKFNTIKAYNAFYLKSIASGKKNIAVTFNTATQNGSNSNHDTAATTFSKNGITIDTVEDMKSLFKNIPLNEVLVALTANTSTLPLLAFYIVAAEEQGVNPEALRGSIISDPLETATINNTNTPPLKASLLIFAHALKYISINMPKYKGITISGYHIQNAGATSTTTLAYTLANGLEYIKQGLALGLDIDTISSKLSFNFGTGIHHFMEIAKLRAARLLWAKLIKPFNPKNQKALQLRVHCQTSDASLTTQDPYNNVTRTTIEAMAATFGGTQSLETNTLNTSTGSPSNLAIRIAKNTQLVLQEETSITKTVDPWAGSYYVEKLTHDIANKTWSIIEDIETQGGIINAIEAGITETTIKASAEKKQTKIETKEAIIIGHNAYVLDKEAPIKTSEINTNTLKEHQIQALNKIKTERNIDKVKQALKNITEAAKTALNTEKKEPNLLALTIIAARERATITEINEALSLGFSHL